MGEVVRLLATAKWSGLMSGSRSVRDRDVGEPVESVQPAKSRQAARGVLTHDPYLRLYWILFVQATLASMPLGVQLYLREKVSR